MHRLKKVLASCIAASLICSALPVYATEPALDTDQTDTTFEDENYAEDEILESLSDIADEIEEELEEDIGDSLEDEAAAVDYGSEETGFERVDVFSVEQTDGELQADDEDRVDGEDLQESSEAAEALLNYLIVDKPYVEPGETQNIILSVGGDGTEISSAVLTYHSQTEGVSFEAEASRIAGGALLFEIYYPETSEPDIYVLDSVSYVIDDVSYNLVFSEIGIDAKYGVSMEVETNPDAYLVDEEEAYEIENGVVAFDEDGNQISGNSIGEAIASEQAQIPSTLAATSSGDVVVVLDPGHDSTHAGAGSADGLREETLNLKIAQYCKEELEKYSGVQVYMTRETEACPFPGSTNSEDLAGRVDYAASVGATVYVCLHLNANDSTSVSGSQVYCPNKNYNAAVSEEGFALADLIMEQLNALGLENRGIYSVDSSSGDKYPDGSARDYYAVIWRSKEAGFPAIIVEHAFLSNTSDVKNYLSSDESLKSLAVADATAIANYYGLKIEGTDIVKKNGQWIYTVDGEPDYTFTGVAKNSNGWWYVENGVVNFNYTGFATNSNGSWYVEDGKVRFDQNSVIKDTTGAIGAKGTWYYVVGSKVQYDFTGLANYKNSNGWWYIKNGVVDFTANGVYKNQNGWYYVDGGKVQFSYNGFGTNSNGSWYVEGGKVRFDQNSVIKDTTGALGTKGTWYYVVGSKVQYDYTGVANYKNENGWWYIDGGMVQFSYNGFGKNENGSWYCENGKVTFNKNSVLKDTTGALGTKGTWYYVVGSKVKYDFTGLAHYKNSNGWWYIKDGVVDFTAEGVYKNQNGWWYVDGGKVKFDYNGFGKNENGSWYCENGKVTFNKNSVLKDTTGALGTKGTWYYVVGSKVQYNFTGLANYRNSNGWWYIRDGVVDFTVEGVCKNQNGWWYVTGGKVDFGYNGIAQNSNGWWYIKNGKVDFNFTGTVTVNGTTYSVTKGKVAR